MAAGNIPACTLTIHSSRSRFAARLNSGVRRAMRIQIALIALVLSSQALAASSSGGNKLSIAGISPGDTLGNITTRLGRPIAQEHSEGFVVLQVRYDRLSFDLDEDG